MIEICCDACGVCASRLFLIEQDRLQHLPGEFRLVVCANCGMYYLNPQPTPAELARYYPNEYFPYSIAIADEASALTRLDRTYGVHKRCRAVMQVASQCGVILDVGCASGNFLNGMRATGWTCHGVEVSGHAAQYARQRFGLNVFTGELQAAHYASTSFDVVTMWDVLEHVYAPRPTLHEIARVLKPGGWLVLSLPNPECVEVKLFGKYWAGWDAPRHLQLFPGQMLTELLARTGFKVERVRSFTGRFHVLSLSLQFLIADRMPTGRLQYTARALAQSNLLRAMLWPYYAVADRLNQSSIMTVFARRVVDPP